MKALDYKKESKKLWLISYPTMIATALQSIYDIVDLAWVGRISKEATAAITIYSVIYWIFAVTNDIVGNSSVSILAQAYGKNDRKRFKMITEQSFTFKLIVGLISTLILFIIQEPVMKMFLDDTETVKLAMRYGVSRTLFMAPAFLSYSMNTTIRATGDSRTPMKIMIISTIANIVIDPILMFDKFSIFGIEFVGFNMGIYGAALATNLSIGISLILGYYVLKKLPKDISPKWLNMLKVNKKVAKDLILIGLPNGIEGLFRNFSMAVLMKFVTAYGTAAVSAAGIGSKLFGFAFMPVYGFLMGGSTIIGHYLGNEEVERADLLGKAASYNSALMMLTGGVVAMIFAQNIMQLFISDIEVIKIGINMIRIVTPGLIIGAFIFGRAVVFIGSGYNKPLFIASIIARWGIQIPTLIIFVNVLRLELNAIWATFILAEIADLLIMYYYYKAGKWKYKRV